LATLHNFAPSCFFLAINAIYSPEEGYEIAGDNWAPIPEKILAVNATVRNTIQGAEWSVL